MIRNNFWLNHFALRRSRFRVNRFTCRDKNKVFVIRRKNYKVQCKEYFQQPCLTMYVKIQKYHV